MEVKNYQLLEKAKEEKVNIYRMEEYPKFSYLVYWIILGWHFFSLHFPFMKWR